jgi:hypothetical protein
MYLNFPSLSVITLDVFMRIESDTFYSVTLLNTGLTITNILIDCYIVSKILYF